MFCHLLKFAAIVALLLHFGGLMAESEEEKKFPLTQDSLKVPSRDYGEWVRAEFSGSKIYPGSSCRVNVFVPAKYGGSAPACVCILQDGGGFLEDIVITNLMESGDIPTMIAVGITPPRTEGVRDAEGGRASRTYSYDTPSPRYGRFILDEILPFVQTLKTSDGRPIKLSDKGSDRMICGSSSGAAAAFSAAWNMPGEFPRVFSAIGSYTGLRGSFEYPTLIHKTEPKPIRIFLQSGKNDMWTSFGDWWSANNSMVRALEFAGYEFDYKFGDGRHSGIHGRQLSPRR